MPTLSSLIAFDPEEPRERRCSSPASSSCKTSGGTEPLRLNDEFRAGSLDGNTLQSSLVGGVCGSFQLSKGSGSKIPFRARLFHIPSAEDETLSRSEEMLRNHSKAAR